VQSLGVRQRDAISTLIVWGRARPVQLAEALQLTSGGLTYVMDQLESDGVVTRTYGSADDRRAVVIELTEKGMELGRVMCDALEAAAPAICAALSQSTFRGRPSVSTTAT
jgi:DNA-binding MarR family transcriptional regulator